MSLLAILVGSMGACEGCDGDTIAPPADGVIRGTVTVDGVGTDGLIVRIGEYGGSGETSFFEVTTSSGGTYQGVVTGDKTWAVNMRPPPGLACSDGAFFFIEGDDEHVQNFTCEEPKGTILGTVELGGEPLAGQPVVIRNLVTEETTTVVTDGAGQYSVEVDLGSYSASVEVPSATCEVSTDQNNLDVNGDSGAFHFTCTLNPGFVEGQVRVEGEPAPGRTVTLRGPGLEFIAATLTDAGGMYSFSDVAAGAAHVSTYIEGAVCPLEERVSVPPAGVAVQDMDCRWAAGDFTMTFTEVSNTCGTPLADPFTVGMKLEYAPVDARVLFLMYLGDRGADTRIPLEQNRETREIAGTGPQFDDGSGILIQEDVTLTPRLWAENPLLVHLFGRFLITGSGAGGFSCTKTFDATALQTD